jgi:tetratricopeptide (TPR) repeat protein
MIATAIFLALHITAIAGQSAETAAGNFRQLAQQAEQARQENRDDDAIRLYKRALVLRPAWPEGLWYAGALSYEMERYADARDTLSRFVALDDKAGPGWALLGLSEFHTREYSRSLDHLQRALALGMGDRASLVHSVRLSTICLLTRMEHYDDAREFMMTIIGSGEDATEFVEPAGLAGLRMPLLPAEIPPQRRELIRMAGEAVIAAGTEPYEDAEPKFKRLMVVYPHDPGVHFLYGAYLMTKNPNEATTEMLRELEITPTNVLVRVRLAQRYMEQNQLERALPLALEGVKLEPRLASAHMILGEVQIAKGDLADGIKELETARAEDSLTMRIHWDLVRAYAAAGRAADAQREKAETERLIQTETARPSQPLEEKSPE